MKRLFVALAATCFLLACEKVQEENVPEKIPNVPVASVSLNPSAAELATGGTLSLSATVQPDNATDKTVTWSSSDSAVATVENGKVSALKEGSAVITAKAGEKTATCKVTVTKSADTIIRGVLMELYQALETIGPACLIMIRKANLP